MIYNQLSPDQTFAPMKKHFPFTVSLSKQTAAKCDQRAREAGITRSAYLTQLIEEDYVKPRRKLVMMDEKMYEKFQKLIKEEPEYPSRSLEEGQFPQKE